MKTLAILFLFAAPAFTQVAMPDPDRTPGDVRPLALAEVCATKWGRDERHLSEAVKKEVCAEYGAPLAGPHRCPGPDWELDHGKSRELAGSDDKKNIWAQPKPEALMKDRLENLLHKMVCATPQKLSLEEAQREVFPNWWPWYKKYFPVEIRTPAAVPRYPFDKRWPEEEARR